MPKFRQRPTGPEIVRRLRQNGECLEWTGGRDAKYGAIHVGRSKYARAHRYAYEVLVGPIPSGMQVLHACDNKLCCNIDHLSLGTNAENMRDKADRARIKSRKLDRSKLERMHQLHEAGTSIRAICRELGVSFNTVSRALARATYYGAQFQ
jgi:hypothetical protein